MLSKILLRKPIERLVLLGRRFRPDVNEPPAQARFVEIGKRRAVRVARCCSAELWKERFVIAQVQMQTHSGTQARASPADPVHGEDAERHGGSRHAEPHRHRNADLRAPD